MATVEKLFTIQGSQLEAFLRNNVRPLLETGDAPQFFDRIRELRELNGDVLFKTHNVCMQFLGQDISDIVIGYTGICYCPNILTNSSFILNKSLMPSNRAWHNIPQNDLVAIAVEYSLNNLGNPGNQEIVKGLVCDFHASPLKALSINHFFYDAPGREYYEAEAEEEECQARPNARLELDYKYFFLTQLKKEGTPEKEILKKANALLESSTYHSSLTLCAHVEKNDEILGPDPRIFDKWIKGCLKAMDPNRRIFRGDPSEEESLTSGVVKADWFADHLLASQDFQNYQFDNYPFDPNALREFAQRLPAFLLNDDSRIRQALVSLKAILPKEIFLSLWQHFPPEIQDLLVVQDVVQ